MILIEDRTREIYDTDTVEVYTSDMALKFKIQNSNVRKNIGNYEIVTSDGEWVATFPVAETVFMLKTQETAQHIVFHNFGKL